MTIQVITSEHTLDTFFHVLEANVNGADGFLDIGYTGEDSKRHDIHYGSGRWLSFFFTPLTVGGF